MQHLQELYQTFDDPFDDDFFSEKDEQGPSECYICMNTFTKTGKNRMIALSTCPFPHSENCCWECINQLADTVGLDNLHCPICRFPFKPEYVLDDEFNIKLLKTQLKHINDEISSIQKNPDYQEMILEYPKMVLDAMNKMPAWFELLKSKKFRNKMFFLMDSLSLSGQGYLLLAKFNPYLLGIVGIGSLASLFFESQLDKELKTHIQDIIALKNRVEEYKYTANYGRVQYLFEKIAQLKILTKNTSLMGVNVPSDILKNCNNLRRLERFQWHYSPFTNYCLKRASLIGLADKQIAALLNQYADAARISAVCKVLGKSFFGISVILTIKGRF